MRSLMAIKQRYLKFLTMKRGLLVLWPPQLVRYKAAFSYLAVVSIVLVIFSPTIASLFGRKSSLLLYITAMILFLPMYRRILIVPFLAIIAASLIMTALNGNIKFLIMGITSYIVFYSSKYESHKLFTAIFILLIIASVVATLQLFAPNPVLNIHATAESVGNFLDQARPTSIFPAQVYFNQFLLLCIPLIYLQENKQPLMFSILGVSAAVSGATGGVVLVGLALLLGLKKSAHFCLYGYVATILIMLVFVNDVVMYNYSPDNLIGSVTERLPAPSAGAVVSNIGFSTKEIVFEFSAILGIVMSMMVVFMLRIPLHILIPSAAGMLAILVGQLIHPTMNSFFFAVSLGLIANVLYTLLVSSPIIKDASIFK